METEIQEAAFGAEIGTNPAERVRLLSRILFWDAGKPEPGAADRSALSSFLELLQAMSEQDLAAVRALANSHHVIMRTFPALLDGSENAGNFAAAESIARSLEAERARIDHALSFLAPICEALNDVGQVLVIKSLDHWPDLGSDLDLFVAADAADVVAIMKRRFQATVAARSWGDRLANKWNFVVPGLPELVEVHINRLGQTGEQTVFVRSLVRRAQASEIGGYSFRVPSSEDRIVIGTLQRMYRHFYFRLCDIRDTANLFAKGEIDYGYLEAFGASIGLWSGIATYLTIVSDYVKSYRGQDLGLPLKVTSSARLRGSQVRFRRNFLRNPILPQSAGMYVSELGRLARNGEVVNTLRLSLLPGLATAAALEFKLTGSDKGVW